MCLARAQQCRSSVCGALFSPTRTCYPYECGRSSYERAPLLAFTDSSAWRSLCGMKLISLIVLSIALLTTAQGKQRTCCKVCRKGKPCGNSCISKAKSCHKPVGCACSSTSDDRGGNERDGGGRDSGTKDAERHTRGRRGRAGVWSAARKLLDTYINSFAYGDESDL